MKTLQQIFDQSLNAIRLQGEPSIKYEAGAPCLYRHTTAEGKQLKCGVGHLIPDAGYSPQFDDSCAEGTESLTGSAIDLLMVESLKLKAALLSVGIDVSDPKVKDLLHTLQKAHDVSSCSASIAGGTGFVAAFNKRMEMVAKSVGLTYSEAS